MEDPKDENAKEESNKDKPQNVRNAPRYVTPTDELVADLVKELNDDLREDFEERAGIIEFDGGFERAHAECLALIDVLSRHPEALTGVIPIRIDGEGQWYVTTHLACARRHLIDTDQSDPVAFTLADIVDLQFDGIALLRPGKKPNG